MVLRQTIAGNPLGAALLAFFILGWSYYMVATILMRGSIFAGMRGYVENKADDGSWFFSKVREMLGCVMCTATEAALWTLGVSTFVVGLSYGVIEQIVGAAVGGSVNLPWPAEVLLTAAMSFALSLAVSGQAWAIKTIVEHRERQFLELREGFRTRENELLARITELESAVDMQYEFDLEVR